MEAHHDHGAGRRRLGIVTLINAAGFVLELAGGLAFGSVALVADAVHMLFDATAYGTAFAAALVAERVEGSDAFPFGLHRLEVVAALVNGMLLIPMAGFILWEAYQRFLAPTDIALLPTAAIALGGLLVNVVSVAYLEHDGMSLNERGAFAHLLGDAAGSVAVLAGLTVIWLTGTALVDPLVAVLIAVFVLWSAGRVLMEGAGIIMQKSPVDPAVIAEAVTSLDGVADAHSIRAWQVCSRVNVCTLHASVTVTTLADAETVRRSVAETLRDRFGMEHVTVQIEQAD